MKLMRTIIILVAMAITMLFAWQANSPAFAKNTLPVCRGANLLETLRDSAPKTHAALIKREHATRNGQGLLWKIERPGIPASYLYGTMHMSDDRLTTLPGPVADALDGAKTVALELAEILDDKQMQKKIIKNIAMLAFTDGRTLDTVLSPDEIRLLKTTLKKYNRSYATMRVMKPWFVMLSIALPQCEMERQKAGVKALDATIAHAGKRLAARIIGLETVGEQFSAFETLSIADQRQFLMNSLRMNHLLEDQIETMTQLYLQRRTAALWEFSLYLTKKFAPKNSRNTQNKELSVLKKFESELIVKRNKVMRTRALPHLKKGKAFIAVGALHLPGEQGLVALLQKAGYTVSVVY